VEVAAWRYSWRHQSDASGQPRKRLFTRTELERMEDAGIFHPDERIELIGGELFQKELPLKSPHATAIRLCEAALRNIFTEGYLVSVQLPLTLSERDEPIPDVAVVPGTIRDYEKHHPSTALLVVEVSETTLRFDRQVKASLYAWAGIPEYWIVNLVDAGGGGLSRASPDAPNPSTASAT
jgi:Uma2 family endonuclease